MVCHSDEQAHGAHHHHQRTSAIRDKGQRDAGHREQADHHAQIDHHLDGEQRNQPDRHIAEKRIVLRSGDAHALMDERKEQADEQHTADEPELLREHGEDEVRLRFGQIEMPGFKQF